MPTHLDHGFWMLDVRKAPIIYNLKSKISKVKRGFTLIELLVVIAIIGILASFAIASFTSAQAKGRDSRRKSDIDALKKALQLYYTDNGFYPNNVTAFASGASSTDSWWNTGYFGADYIKTVPTDPRNGSTYFYNYNTPAGHLTYTLSADLENNNDPQRSLGCNSSAPTHDYCTYNP